MRIFKGSAQIIFFLILVFSSFQVNAIGDGPVLYDNVSRNWKNYDTERIESFKSDPDFIYETAKAELNLWDRLWNWLINLFGEIFNDKDGLNIFKAIEYLLYVLGISAVFYLLVKVIQSRLSTAVFGNTALQNDYHIGEENIHEIDFATSIEGAVEQGEFRKAIRLIYLMALKLLSDKHMISWESGKTNHEYLFELKNKNIEKPFSSLGYFFEFTWYGNFTADREIYERTYETLKELESQLPADEKNGN